jgi:hypothetical protein
VTDLAAKVTANMRDEPPLENWDGTTGTAQSAANRDALGPAPGS